ncbi:ATP-dependent Zn protease [Candidatus Phytoplasma luffae]|uniref:ATP-dependent Zn protease n=1 Tax=Loofah witches'-broom phytoplasma TaxID=35773 RepID=A0A975FIP0_LOWBP|nr:ATP-binding protein [Candidatus Phytoplasma luffae]QTX03195.1 ATP-dependent Zn protease [Candidatus Phytoplasma luffae]
MTKEINFDNDKFFWYFKNIILIVLSLISCVLVFYIWEHHNILLNNEKQITQINKNLLKLEKFNNHIQNNIKKLEKNLSSENDSNNELFPENKDNFKKINNSDDNIFLASENFVSKNYNKFLSFDQLSCLNEAKSVAKGFINFFKYKETFQNRGKVSVPKGLMMYGTPGCGKTIFASSIAKETELPFIDVSCSVFAQELVGKAPKMVVELFDLAKKAASKSGKGAIIFLDECENVFLNISSLKPGSEIANVVNEFKIQLEPRPEDINFEQPIFVIAATNHIDGIEPAILSRFTHSLELKPGDKEERKIQLQDILKSNQFPITKEAKEFLLEIINNALEYLPPQYEKDINGLLIEIPIEKNFKKAYRVLDILIKEASLKSIEREINNLKIKKECSHPQHKERFVNNQIFIENNNKKQKTDASILGNCCECKAINIEDLRNSYQVVIDNTLASLKKAESIAKS